MNTSSRDDDTVSQSVKDSAEFNEKVDKYYQYKSIYEKAIQDKKRKIKKNAVTARLSNRETMSAFQKYKPPCVSCMRPVGTIFEKKKTNDVYHLLARCGDTVEPCQLDIDIQMGDIFDVLKEKREEETKMNAYINEIIIIKNDELFGFITEDDALNKFIKLNKELDTVIDNYRSLLSAYIEVRNNTKNNTQINELSSKLTHLIGNIKKNMNDYVSTGNIQFIHETAEIYATDIIKLVGEINKLKYKSMRMEYDPETGVHKLFQKITLVDSFQFHGNMKTIRFVIGKELKTKKTATRKSDTSFTESEAQFSQGPLADNITNMSMRDAIDNENDRDSDSESNSNEKDLDIDGDDSINLSSQLITAPTAQPVRLTSANLSSIPQNHSNVDDDKSDIESDGTSVMSDDSSIHL